MTALLGVDAAGGGRDDGKDATVAQGIASFLSLAATPTFAIMAALAGLPHAGPIEMLCSMGPRSPLGGMVPMYLLMAAVHLPAWLRVIVGRWEREGVSLRARAGSAGGGGAGGGRVATTVPPAGSAAAAGAQR